MNLETAKQEFIKYAEKYDTTNSNIKRKINHSLRVMALSLKIAQNLGMDEADIEVATLIGLLHDIGRFDQMKIYNTFNDQISVDHGDYGAEVLFKNNYIRKYIQEDVYDEIIKTAIKNHNKLTIQEDLNKNQLLFAKIIRDADKLDIMYQATCITWQNEIEKVENAKLESNNIAPFAEKRLVNRKKDLINEDETKAHLLTVLGFPFDINFDITFKIIKEKDYINKIVSRFDFKDKQTKKLVNEIVKIVNDYIKDKCKSYNEDEEI